ncbi:MAG: PPC domain-containing protein [Planctomycetes bacterium]|nr:PPC domain-containing protein [Planctomycetota bacterium]
MTHPSSLIPVLVLASSIAAQRIAEVEPNDTVAQAQPLTAGTQITANLAAGEQDWFTFTLAAPAEVHLRTTGNFAVNPSVDTGVFLFDASGTAQLAWNDNAAGVLSDCGVNLGAGTYSVLVIGKLATTAGDYGLDFVTLPAAVINAVEGPEPNHDPGLGGTPTPITLGSTIAGNLSSPTDVDWYSFSITGRAVVQSICYDDGSVPQLDNTGLQFFQELAPGVYGPFSPAGSSSLTTSHRSFNLSHPTTLAAGNYAIQVAAGSAAAGTAPFSYTKTGNYAIRTRLIDMPGTFTVAEGPEPNNVPGSPNVPFFTLGDTLSGNCSGGNEEDWWAFVVGGPTTIALMCDGGSPSPMTNEDLRLFDATGTLITTASSGGPGSHGRMIYTLPQGGIYYVAAYGGAFALTGDYVVYTGSCDPMYVTGDFRATPPSTNACPGSNNLRPALKVASTESPQLGSTFVVQLANTLPNALAIPFYGFSRNTAIGGTVPLPFDMTPLEPNQFNHCMVRVDPLITSLLITDANGIGYIDYVLPPVPGLQGLPVFMQSMQLDPAIPNNPYGVSMSNDARILIGTRSY